MWLVAQPGLADVTISVTVEPAVIPLGAEATLVVTVKGKFRKSSQPQLPTLDEITFYQAGSSQSFSIVNGRATSSLQFNYVVVAHKEGRYSIGPIRFETGGNTYTAKPVTRPADSHRRIEPPPDPGIATGQTIRQSASMTTRKTVSVSSSEERKMRNGSSAT